MNSDDEIIGPINLGNKQKTNIRELAEIVLKLTDFKSKIVYKLLTANNPKVECSNTD